MAAKTGATSSRPTASTPAASSIRPSSPSSTTRATSKTSSTASTTPSPRRLHPSRLNYSRSWFQTPNSYDNLNVQNVVSGGATPTPSSANVGNTDQRSKIVTVNIAPTYTRIIGNIRSSTSPPSSAKTLQLLPQRQSAGRPGPCQPADLVHRQDRTLANAGIHSDFSYAKGIHNIKAARNIGRPSCASTTASASSIPL
jgi:hypothetical protein